MVLSSIAPLFVIWAIRGSRLISDSYLVAFCGLMVFGPYAFLWLRISTARKHEDKRVLAIGKAEDHRDHLLVYLFAMLLPFYGAELGTWRELLAMLVALSFIVFLFWHLNLHYMNLLFAVLGYRVFTIYPPAEGSPLSGRESLVLISRRETLPVGGRMTVYRLSDTVYFDEAVQ
jgi:hypothetical protein